MSGGTETTQREVTFEDRLTVAAYAGRLLEHGPRTSELTKIGDALLDAVRCCGEFPECSHVLAWVEAHDA